MATQGTAPPPYSEEDKKYGPYPPAGPGPQHGYPAQQTGPGGQQYQPVSGPQYSGAAQPVVVVSSQVFGPEPIQMTCPYCNSTVVTSISYEIGLFTWLLVGIMFLTVLWICCWIPCVIDSCKDVEHTCPSCQRLIGRYKRL